MQLALAVQCTRAHQLHGPQIQTERTLTAVLAAQSGRTWDKYTSRATVGVRGGTPRSTRAFRSGLLVAICTWFMWGCNARFGGRGPVFSRPWSHTMSGWPQRASCRCARHERRRIRTSHPSGRRDQVGSEPAAAAVRRRFASGAPPLACRVIAPPVGVSLAEDSPAFRVAWDLFPEDPFSLLELAASLECGELGAAPLPECSSDAELFAASCVGELFREGP